jgi:hypothetical protein
MVGITVLERQIENPTVAWARNVVGLYVTKLNVMGDKSIPDRCFWLPGYGNDTARPFIIEFKAPKKDPTRGQLRKINLLRKLGYTVEVHDNVKEAKIAILKQLQIRGMDTSRIPT